jgi:hypothetical protein
MILRLIYVSAATRLLDDAALAALLEESRARNAEDAITGMLLYNEGSFMQVLEGPPDAVRACYARIQRDERHTRVTTVLEDVGRARDFAAWSMGFLNGADLRPEELAGFTHFLSRGVTPADLPPAAADPANQVRAGTAREALLAFRESVR